MLNYIEKQSPSGSNSFGTVLPSNLPIQLLINDISDVSKLETYLSNQENSKYLVGNSKSMGDFLFLLSDDKPLTAYEQTNPSQIINYCSISDSGQHSLCSYAEIINVEFPYSHYDKQFENNLTNDDDVLNEFYKIADFPEASDTN
ncbi:hypothetical protein ILUMI_26872 [Ignelater luminosus]|uniref:Uncharacterized protein n=1 Tax=Ignelater luminosus TaxID=2038154 RepID=A0A8K0FX72_IGNLU|nr:hypothetical protein ILUMI_26872 [Ignelater luminosus]